MTLPCITVRQPWASLIAAGVKTIETRSKPTKVRGRIGIHAAAGQRRGGPGTFYPAMNGGVHLHDGAWCFYQHHGDPNRPTTTDLPLPLGAIVATAELVDAVPIISDNDYQMPDRPCIENSHHGLLRWRASERWPTLNGWSNITDQLPYGDFSCGRYAWLLADVKPTTERCPACWATGRVQDGDPGHAYVMCSTCSASGGCPPIPFQGTPGWWRWEP